MLRSLRRRLVLSHALPLLLITPLAGLALIYVIETQVLLPSISGELKAQAILVAKLAGEQTGVFQDPTLANGFVEQMAAVSTTRVMLVDTSGRLLASSDPADSRAVGRRLDLPGLTMALNGEVSVRTVYSRNAQASEAAVIAPVFGPNRQLVGAVRLTHEQISIYEWFARLRSIIAAVLAVSAAFGIGLGLLLAWNVDRPLKLLTGAVSSMASGREVAPVPEQGPEEIRLLAGAFNMLRKQLQELEQTRTRLLANLVHELSRPLGALLSAVQALQGGANEDPVLRHDLLAGMEEEILRLQGLVNDLTHLKGLALGPLELHRRPVPLSEWLSQTLAPWREAARSQGLRWETMVPPRLPAAEIDGDRVAQALGNLVSNAIKYTPPGGKVAVAVEVQGFEVALTVSDTGPGIPLDEQEMILTPFYRGQRERRFPQGMGLGLTIARDIVTAHGGRMEIDSAPGSGSRFTLLLPLKSRDQQDSSWADS